MASHKAPSRICPDCQQTFRSFSILETCPPCRDPLARRASDSATPLAKALVAFCSSNCALLLAAWVLIPGWVKDHTHLAGHLLLLTFAICITGTVIAHIQSAIDLLRPLFTQPLPPEQRRQLRSPLDEPWAATPHHPTPRPARRSSKTTSSTTSARQRATRKSRHELSAKTPR